MRCRLFAAQAGQCRRGSLQPLRGLLDGAGQQGVRGEFAEDPVAVLECSPNGRGEAHGLPKVVHPVPGIALRDRARIGTGSRVKRNLRRHRCEICQRGGEVGEDRIHLRRVRGDVDGHFACHDVPALPVGDQLADLRGVAADHRALGRGDHRHDDVLDAAAGQFVADGLLGQID